MNQASRSELLKSLEWSGSRTLWSVAGEPHTEVSCCPRCRGFETVPSHFKVGGPHSGFATVNTHPDHLDEVGHQDDCSLAEAIKSLETEPQISEVLTRSFCALTEMWGRRYDTPSDDIPEVSEGEPFGAPVAVDVGLLAEAQTHLFEVVKHLLPELYAQMTNGGAPDVPLARPQENLVDLDKHRIQTELEFPDEQVAYAEFLWGRTTFGYNLAIRDLEQMRRGKDDGSLRPPETYHEIFHLIRNLREMASHIAQTYGLEPIPEEKG